MGSAIVNDRNKRGDVIPRVSIQFDTTAFYGDLVAVCHAALAKNWNDEVKNRYNSWLVYDLDPEKSKKRIAEVIAEIAKL